MLYENKNHVFFAVSKFEDYGKLSNKNLDELKAGSRIEISDLKKNPMDFVLWKPSNEKEPALGSVGEEVDRAGILNVQQ